MDNRGKLWSIDDDQKLMETPHVPDATFATIMGRTPNAIKMRRSHLAAKMYQNDSTTPLEEYVALMNADFEQASTLLIEWSEKRASFKTFLDSNRKRKSQEAERYAQIPNSPPPEFQKSRFFRNNAPQPKQEPPQVDLPTYWHDQTSEDKIETICKSIRDEGGNLASVFNDPQFLPCLIQHYQGFEAYARIVQARGLQ
jgi:hypothetical protein